MFMNHPDDAALFARARVQELERFRPALPVARPTGSTEPSAPILIRRSEIIDRPALTRLAALDSGRILPEGQFLLAEVAGEIVAAVSIDTYEPGLADPFRPTENVLRLLELRARRLRRSGDAPGRGRRITSTDLPEAA
jgi:hypothetical protein